MDERRTEGQAPYFPPPYGPVECDKCELRGTCRSCGKYQRSRRDFTVTSGRCPRLPDGRGLMAPEQQALYASLFPLVHAEREEDRLTLKLQLPGGKRPKNVYRARSGAWYFRDTYEGRPVKRALTIPGAENKESILYVMAAEHTGCCVFRCRIEDYCV